MVKKVARILTGALLLTTGLAAHSNSIEILVNSLTPVNEYSAEATCGVAICIQGITGDSASALLSDTEATRYEVSPNSPAEELSVLNGLLGTSITAVNKTDLPGFSITTDREYFSFKKGDWTAFFRNVSGGLIEISFNTPAGDDGFSHWTEYGEASVVPLPAAIPLFLSGLGLLGFLGFRRRTREAS